jgi:GNAT superfamily N-acetyltransferase
MKIRVYDNELKNISDYTRVSIAFEVRSVLDVANDGSGRFVLTERSVPTPYLKDYDAIAGNSPSEWLQQFSVSNLRMFIAEMNCQLVGGAIVARDSPELATDDTTVLYDIRVAPHVRGQGSGAELFCSASTWARTSGSRVLEAETQNINIPACRFYEKQGCELIRVERDAYQDFPDEIRFIWQKYL